MYRARIAINHRHTFIGKAPTFNTLVMSSKHARPCARLAPLLPSRDKDTLGLGFSYAQLSHDLIGDSGHRIASHHEAVLELTYQAAFGDHVSVQPDLQLIFNPGAVTPASTAVVTGIRLNVRF